MGTALYGSGKAGGSINLRNPAGRSHLFPLTSSSFVEEQVRGITTIEEKRRNSLLFFLRVFCSSTYHTLPPFALCDLPPA